MFNKVILVGNLTKDIELRYTPSGTAVGNTGIAVNRKFKGSDGQMKDEVLFIDLTFFGRTAEIANQYLRKGSKILTEGRLKYDTWTDQNGGKRSKHSITVENMTMLDSKGGYNVSQQQTPPNTQQPQTPQQGANDYSAPQQDNYSTQQNTPAPKQEIPEINLDDDEIPF